MMPGVPKEVRNAEIDDRQIGRIEAIIRSMTTAERIEPDLIDGSRRVRIATGSGTDPTEVGRAASSSSRRCAKMMKRMGGMGTKRLPSPAARRPRARARARARAAARTGGGGSHRRARPRCGCRTSRPVASVAPGLPNLGGTGPNGLPDLGLGDGFRRPLIA